MLLTLPALSLAQDATTEDATVVKAGNADPDSWQDPEAAGAEDSQADAKASDADTGTSEADAEPEIDAVQVAEGAMPLYALITRSFALDAATFLDGEPDAMTAWAISYAALEQGALEGLSEGVASPESVAEAYRAIFASGELPEMPEGFTLLKLADGQYRQTSDPGDEAFLPSLLGATAQDGAVDAEVAVMARAADAPADLDALLSVTLVPDAEAPFGARLAGYRPITGAPAFTKAEATAALEDYKDITYAPENVLDGNLGTCWAYPKEDEGAVITLSSDEPQTVRGIRLTPAYAKSEKIALANNRVKSFHVELSDGAAFDFGLANDLPRDDFDSLASFAFDAAHEVTWVTVTVTDVYPGGKYTDTCISEIALF
jgi:hypothetical protein